MNKLKTAIYLTVIINTNAPTDGIASTAAATTQTAAPTTRDQITEPVLTESALVAVDPSSNRTASQLTLPPHGINGGSQAIIHQAVQAVGFLNQHSGAITTALTTALSYLNQTGDQIIGRSVRPVGIVSDVSDEDQLDTSVIDDSAALTAAAAADRAAGTAEYMWRAAQRISGALLPAFSMLYQAPTPNKAPSDPRVEELASDSSDDIASDSSDDTDVRPCAKTT